ncbi:MAG: ATP-dependent zinc metalloprotease FtsH [Kiritimatiellae bacterium]|nr:ATP-dependent zinc metalloprotease FtsH [Kiritimatiellia bacterium]
MSNETQKPAAKPDGKSVGAMRSWLIIAAAVALFFTFYKTNPGEPAVHELTQTEFYKALDEGKIVEPIIRFLDRDDGVTYLTGEMETDKVDKDGKPLADKNGEPVRVTYRVALVPGENENLMEDLFTRQLQVKVRERRSPLSPLVMNILFFGGMMFLFYWFFYRKMGGGDGVFGFGKSRAKLLDGKAEKAKVTFADVAGVDEAKEEVQEIVAFLKEPAAFRKLGGRIPKGVLLVGPPGTGKTLLAKAIAGEAQVPFFAISGSDFEEMFVGVGASRMRDMFAEAKKKAPCIIFIDEIDSIGMKRTGAGALGGNRYNEQTLNTMLVEMDGFSPNEGVIVIAATNRPDTLDAALLRPGRFDRQVMIDLPTLKGREEILALHGKKIKFGPDADLSRIARGTPGFSGADLANLLNEAALMAVRKKLEAVDMETLEEARDKVLWGRERKSAGYSQKDREITAWHESGHAILQLLAKNADPLHKVTIIPRGRALGVTMSLPERDILNRTKSHFLDELVICCGGRIAEKMFTGEISTGAAQDIAMATEIARKMVCTYGMSEKFGFQAFNEPSPYASIEAMPPAFSEETSRAIDAEVAKLVSDAYAKAEKAISENKEKVELLAKTLLERETMDGRDVAKLVGLEREETPQTSGQTGGEEPK